MTSPDRQALEAVLEALAIPHAATTGGDTVRNEVLVERIRHVVVFLEGLLRDEQAPQGWRIDYLRERLAEHPPTGYVTHDQAHARLRAGASWTDAVRYDDMKENQS